MLYELVTKNCFNLFITIPFVLMTSLILCSAAESSIVWFIFSFILPIFYISIHDIFYDSKGKRNFIFKNYKPIAITLTKSKFIFELNEPTFVPCDRPTSLLAYGSKVEIPNNSCFELSKDIRIKILTNNNNHLTTFRTYSQYQTEPNREAKQMKKNSNISFEVGARIKMLLPQGLRYQKIINGFYLTKSDGYPLIDTLWEDTEAYYLGGEA